MLTSKMYHGVKSIIAALPPRYGRGPQCYRTGTRPIRFEPLEGRRLLAAGDIEWIDQFGALTDEGPGGLTASAPAIDDDGNVYVAGCGRGALDGAQLTGRFYFRMSRRSETRSTQVSRPRRRSDRRSPAYWSPLVDKCAGSEPTAQPSRPIPTMFAAKCRASTRLNYALRCTLPKVGLAFLRALIAPRTSSTQRLAHSLLSWL
jgi:hypothetical protein